MRIREIRTPKTSARISLAVCSSKALPSFHRRACADGQAQGCAGLEGDVWGHRKDLDEYFTVDNTTLEEIRALTAGGASVDDVADLIQKKTKIGSELIKYIAKTKITA